MATVTPMAALSLAATAPVSAPVAGASILLSIVAWGGAATFLGAGVLMTKKAFSDKTGSEKVIIPDDSRVANDFECPITMEIMDDPVICCDGFTYERRAIEEWLGSDDG